MSDKGKEKQLYTSEELIWATQLAYCNFTKEEITDEKNIQKIISNRGPEIYYNYKPDSNPTGDAKTMKESTENFIKDVAEGKKCKGWKVVSVCVF